MKIEVEVKKVEQSHDLNTGLAQNYLVFELFGVEHRVPCDETVVLTAIKEAVYARVAGQHDSAPARVSLRDVLGEQPVATEAKVASRPLFIQAGDPDLDSSDLPEQVPERPSLQISRAPRVASRAAAPSAPVQEPAPARRGHADDAGIAQG